jgi:hypothetical protein
MKRSGKEVTRASLQHSLDGLGRYDAGGYVVQFKPGSHYSGNFVSIALLTPSGEVRE